MTTLKEYRNSYYEFSGKVSDLVLKLSFAGIAIIWMFKIEDGKLIQLPKILYVPSLLLVLTLFLHLLQYIYATILWGVFSRLKEKEHFKEDDKIDANARYNWPTISLFWLKVLALTISYLCILFFILGKIDWKN